METTKKNNSKAELDEALGEALEATFPASDPVEVGRSSADQPDRPAHRRPAPIDKALVEKLAREVSRKKGAA